MNGDETITWKARCKGSYDLSEGQAKDHSHGQTMREKEVHLHTHKPTNAAAEVMRKRRGKARASGNNSTRRVMQSKVQAQLTLLASLVATNDSEEEGKGREGKGAGGAGGARGLRSS